MSMILPGVFLVATWISGVAGLSYSNSDVGLTAVPDLTSDPTLDEIDIDGNAISRIEYNAFQGLLYLIKINLSHNRIYFVDDTAFADCACGLRGVEN